MIPGATAKLLKKRRAILCGLHAFSYLCNQKSLEKVYRTEEKSLEKV